MQFTLFLTRYLGWHYSGGVVGFLSVWRNFYWFSWHFFSIGLLLRTLFSPFQKLNEEYKRTLDMGAIMSTFLVNLIMRLVGAAARSFIIAFGLVSLFVITVAGTALFVVWLLLPLASFTFLILGINGFLRQ